MKITVTGKNIEGYKCSKECGGKKLEKLDKYFKPDIEAQVTLSVEKNRQIIEVTIPFNGLF